MSTLSDKLNIEGFELNNISLAPLEELQFMLPTDGVLDLNIAEGGLMQCLWAQDFCQEKIILIDRLISRSESVKDKAMANAGLIRAAESGYKTAKDKEWFAKSDDDYIEACNQISLAKAGKKFFENKASFFSGWYFAFKTFLGRDYNLERSSKDNFDTTSAPTSMDWEIDWN